MTDGSGSGAAVPVVIVVVLLVVAIVAVLCHQKQKGVAANAAVLNEFQQDEDRRNTFQMEDNPMAAAKRSGTTTVQNPLFRIAVNTPNVPSAATYADPAPPTLDADYYEVAPGAASQSSAAHVEYATYSPVGGGTYAIPFEIGGNETETDGDSGVGTATKAVLLTPNPIYGGGSSSVARPSEGDYSSYAAPGAGPPVGGTGGGNRLEDEGSRSTETGGYEVPLADYEVMGTDGRLPSHDNYSGYDVVPPTAGNSSSGGSSSGVVYATYAGVSNATSLPSHDNYSGYDAVAPATATAGGNLVPAKDGAGKGAEPV